MLYNLLRVFICLYSSSFINTEVKKTKESSSEKKHLYKSTNCNTQMTDELHAY